MPMPKGRPESAQHTKSYIIVGLAQGFLLTLTIFLMIGLGL
jgi:hypothetical protein